MKRRHKFVDKDSSERQGRVQRKIIPQIAERRQKETIKDPAEWEKHAEKEKAGEAKIVHLMYNQIHHSK